VCDKFDWIQFLRLAQSMKGHPWPVPTPECKNRTITNRAYYAAYNLAKAYIDEVSPLRFRDDRPTHGDVSGWFRGQDDQVLKRIGRRLRDSYNRRHAADYDNEPESFAVASEEVIYWSEQIVREIMDKREEAG